ncbi:Relaxin receptor 1, partial [Pseudolycoriella hygida]
FLGNNEIQIRNDIFQNISISYLNLVGITEDNIDFDEIRKIPALKAVFYDKFHFCSKTPHIQKCRPNTDGISSFNNLLDKPILRQSVWPIVAITTVGNTLVLISRFRDENRAVSMVIRNLALADILMGVYLSIIGIQDFRFREKYHEYASDWVASFTCTAAGVLAMISSEVSLMILTFMSVERFMLIATQKRVNTTIFLYAIWLSGIIYWRSSTRFYGAYSGTCFPIHLEPFPLGWQYSAFVFLGVNTILLIVIATLYTALFRSIWITRRKTPLATFTILDCEFAIRFFFIVLTDCTCWVPIMVMKVLVFLRYEISVDVYAWLVVFVLPLNSAVNPLLYTFTTPKYRSQILPWGWTRLTGRSQQLTGSGGASNQAESQGKVIPLISNTSNTSKFKL